MKKLLLLFLFVSFYLLSQSVNYADSSDVEPMIKIEIPASEIDRIDLKYQDKSVSSKVVDQAKEISSSTKNATSKVIDATKTTTKKAVTKTKNFTNKALSATKNAKDKTVSNTKEVVDSLNPNKPVTLESLELEANIKTLKNERNEIKKAYNSRIKDIDAKIKAALLTVDISDVQKQNIIYSLEKEKKSLINDRDLEIEKYNKKIEIAKKK